MEHHIDDIIISHHNPKYKLGCMVITAWPDTEGMICSNVQSHNVWASYQIRKIAGCACAGNAGNVFPRRRIQRKTLVSDPVMHHGTCVTHVPWCMSGSLTRCGGENVPGILGACAPVILHIWQEAHGFHDSIVITQYCMQYGHCYGKTKIITLNSWMRLCSSSIREDIYREYFTKQSVRTTATPITGPTDWKL